MTEEEIELTADSVLERNNEIMTAEMGEELVMLHIDQGSYFGLDEIGRAIWARIEKPTSLGDLCAALQVEYDAEAGTVETDVKTFITRLTRNDLVTIDGEKVA